MARIRQRVNRIPLLFAALSLTALLCGSGVSARTMSALRGMKNGSRKGRQRMRRRLKKGSDKRTYRTQETTRKAGPRSNVFLRDESTRETTEERYIAVHNRIPDKIASPFELGSTGYILGEDTENELDQQFLNQYRENGMDEDWEPEIEKVPLGEEDGPETVGLYENEVDQVGKIGAPKGEGPYADEKTVGRQQGAPKAGVKGARARKGDFPDDRNGGIPSAEKGGTTKGHKGNAPEDRAGDLPEDRKGGLGGPSIGLDGANMQEGRAEESTTGLKISRGWKTGTRAKTIGQGRGPRKGNGPAFSARGRPEDTGPGTRDFSAGDFANARGPEQHRPTEEENEGFNYEAKSIYYGFDSNADNEDSESANLNDYSDLGYASNSEPAGRNRGPGGDQKPWTANGQGWESFKAGTPELQEDPSPVTEAQGYDPTLGAEEVVEGRSPEVRDRTGDLEQQQSPPKGRGPQPRTSKAYGNKHRNRQPEESSSAGKPAKKKQASSTTKKTEVATPFEKVEVEEPATASEPFQPVEGEKEATLAGPFEMVENEPELPQPVTSYEEVVFLNQVTPAPSPGPGSRAKEKGTKGVKGESKKGRKGPVSEKKTKAKPEKKAQKASKEGKGDKTEKTKKEAKEKTPSSSKARTGENTVPAKATEKKMKQTKATRASFPEGFPFKPEPVWGDGSFKLRKGKKGEKGKMFEGRNRAGDDQFKGVVRKGPRPVKPVQPSNPLPNWQESWGRKHTRNRHKPRSFVYPPKKPKAESPHEEIRVAKKLKKGDEKKKPAGKKTPKG